MRFDSPTVNLWISQPDFFKLAHFPREYIFSDFTYEGIREQDGAPIGSLNGPLGPIRIFFNHYPSFEDGVSKWKERAERIHWDNLYYITSDGNGLTFKEMEEFKDIECKNKVIFVSKDQPLDYCLTLKGFEKEKSAARHMLIKHKFISTKYVWEDSFDYVAFLNH